MQNNLIAKEIKRIRTLSGLNQTEFGKQIGRDQYLVSCYELGKYKPSMTALKEIIKFAQSQGIEIDLNNLLDI